MKNSPLRRSLLAASVALAALLAGPVGAAESTTTSAVTSLNDLIASGRYMEAYTLANQLMDKFEGEPEFDFLFGLAAIETGHPNEAVFALERITYTFPDQQRVKLELARALYLMNDLPGSRQMFNDVLATNPDDNIEANISVFMDLIDEREKTIAGSFNWYLNSNLGNDSNINSATELGVIPTPIGDVELSANGQSIDDNFNDIGGGVMYSKPFSKTSAVSVGSNISHHNNMDSDDFDLDVLAADGSYAHMLGTSRLSYVLRAQQVDLNNEHFQKSASFIANMQRSAGNGWTQSVTGAFTQVRYDDSLNKNASLRDVNQSLVSAVLGKVMGSFNNTVSLYYGTESAQRELGKNNAQQFYGVAFAEQYQINSSNLPYFRISLHRSDNKAADPIFNIEREDDTFSTSLGWIWLLKRNLNITTDVTYTNNDSNIKLYEYDRFKYQTGLRYQF